MPRTSRMRRNRARGVLIPYDFQGWTTGSSKAITTGELGMDLQRPSRIVRCSVQHTCSATNATYAVPSNACSVTLSLYDDAATCVAMSAPRLVTFGALVRQSVRAPRSTNFTQWSANSAIVRLEYRAVAPNSTNSFCGTVWIQYSPHRIPQTIKLFVDGNDEDNQRVSDDLSDRLSVISIV